MRRLYLIVTRLLAHRHGGAVIEYCLIAGLIALGLVGVISQIGQTTNANYVSVQAGFE